MLTFGFLCINPSCTEINSFKGDVFEMFHQTVPDAINIMEHEHGYLIDSGAPVCKACKQRMEIGFNANKAEKGSFEAGGKENVKV